MTSTEIHDIVEQMQRLYVAPKGVDRSEFFSALGDELAKIDADVLPDAWEHLKVCHKFAVCPRLPDFHAAAEAVKKRRAEAKARQIDEEERSYEAKTAMRRRWAWDQLQTELGRQAARGDWALELLEFLDREGRMPSGPEIDAICRRAEDNYRMRQRSRENLEKHRGEMLNTVLWELFDGMEARRARVNRRALGEEETGAGE